MEDPFRFHPDLADRIRPPAESRFRTFDPADLDARMIAAGQGPDWRVPDDAREANRERILAARPAGPLWVFAMGSLMSDPGVHFDLVRRATLAGFRRSFCLRATAARGSEDTPGLMPALVPGGACEGLALRIPEHLVDAESRILWRREMMVSVYRAEFRSLQMADGSSVTGLTYLLDPESDRYMPDVPRDTAAGMIARAVGGLGSNAEYLADLVAQLDHLGVDDPEIFDLHRRVNDLTAR